MSTESPPDSNPTTANWLQDSLKRNETLITVAAVIVAAAATFIAALEYHQTTQQTALVSKQTELADKELALIETQTRLAANDLAPHFIFSNGNPLDLASLNSTLFAKCSNAKVRALAGDCVLFLEVTSRDNKKKFLKIDNCFTPPPRPVETSELAFKIDGDLYITAMAAFRVAFGGSSKVPLDTTKVWPVRPRLLVTLQYYTMLREQCSEQYAIDFMPFSFGNVVPHSDTIAFDKTIDAAQFKTGDKLDIDRLTALVQDEIEALRNAQ